MLKFSQLIQIKNNNKNSSFTIFLQIITDVIVAVVGFFGGGFSDFYFVKFQLDFVQDLKKTKCRILDKPFFYK